MNQPNYTVKTINSKGNTFDITLSNDPQMLKQVKTLDDSGIGAHHPLKTKDLEKIANDGGMLVVMHDEQVVGYSLLIFSALDGIKSFAEDTAMPYGTFVSPEYRRLGLGEALIMQQESLAKSKGFKKLMLSVRPENAAAVLLRLKLGYCITSFDQDFFGQGKARLIMEKNLEDEIQPQLDTSSYVGRILFSANKPLDGDSLMMLKLAFGAGLVAASYQLEDNNLIKIQFRRKSKA
jgi:ribosomal protein S18 acetylase RimI-like enzyme